MKFETTENFMYAMLKDWEKNDKFYYFDYMPSGEFGIYLVEATNSKQNNGKRERYVDVKILEILFESPLKIKRKIGDIKTDWPTSFFKSISEITRRGILKIFDKETKIL